MPQDVAALRATLSLAPVIPVIILDDVQKARPLAEALVGFTSALTARPAALSFWMLTGRCSVKVASKDAGATTATPSAWPFSPRPWSQVLSRVAPFMKWQDQR